MSLKFVVFSAMALTILCHQSIEGVEPVSKCGLNEVYAPCGPNGCNTYDCKNQDGSNVGCAAVCSGEPACVCEKKYHRATPDAPCTRLECPKPLILPIPLTPSSKTCETKLCGRNEQCTECAPNSCNTYSCGNPAGLFCRFACIEAEPRCMCSPGYHRPSPGAPCIRLRCPKPKPLILPHPWTPSIELSCNTIDCAENSVCTTCEPNECNTYSCGNPAGLFCKFACIEAQPRCMCNPGYHRATQNGPCVPLDC